MTEKKEPSTLILSATIQISVDREDGNGVPFATLDKIKDYLTQAVQLNLDREGVGDLDDDHSVTALFIDWDTLQFGIVGQSNWKCPSCGDIQTIRNRLLEQIGTPMCGNCDCEMNEFAANRVKCVQVEFDPEYFGGNYAKVGDFVHIPLALIDEIKESKGLNDDQAIQAAFEKVTGLNRPNIIHYSFNEDELVDQEGNGWD